MSNASIAEGLRLIFGGIAHLRGAFPDRAFTIDGRLVGDIGEVIAALEYDEVFNGPGRIIAERYRSRKGIGVNQLSFPIEELRKLSALVPDSQKIALRRPLSTK